MLAYLALEEAGAATRERLVGLLWSEAEEEKARASLRQVVHELREALQAAGFSSLQAGRATLGLDAHGTILDAREVLRQAEAGTVHPLLLDVPHLDEMLLIGLEDLDPAFRVWLMARRQAVHDRLLRVLETMLRQEGVARLGRRQAARAILHLDPTHEEACRALMRDCAEAGDPVAALRAYEALWRVLAEDYDTEPTLATQQLVADIKLGRLEPPPQQQGRPEAPPLPHAAAPAGPRPAPSAPAASTPTVPPRIALLVEPFAVHGVGPDRQHLVQGFRHDLIARLVRFREWFVVDGPTLPPPDQTRARVSGRYRIGASAYSAGERISMALTLAEQESGIFVWSERLELSLDGWFEAQQHVLRRIAIALNMQISSARLARLAGEPDVTLEGYDRWLRCQQMVLSFSHRDWDRAFGMLEEMAARTPAFAPTYSHLAQLDNLAHIIRPGTHRARAREQRALANARRAVELDPMDSRSQLHLGWSLTMAGQHAQADVPMRLALELNPDDSWLVISLALFHAFNGEHELAETLGRQSLRMTLVPSAAHWAYEVTNAYLRGDDAAALEACDRSADVIRTMQAWRAAALHNLGRRQEAAAAAERFCTTVSACWYGQSAPTPETITRWLLHLYPIRRPDDWERLRRGVAGAGLPTAGAAHGGWYDAAF
ncbi:BTAD domain-containing putative transcriptional regulator [Craurococcus roseus]|uniref:BTAD domain-containing putative transcriptional regulator n=1 Tax=Craurococcus roseus TaxID=77585 RepID=UPI0031DDDCB4